MATPAAADPGGGFAVTVPDLVSTSVAFARQHDVAASAADTASGGLAGTAGMAGDDEVLAPFRSRYDAVAGLTWLAAGATASSMHGIAVLLADPGDADLRADRDASPDRGAEPERLPRPPAPRRLPAGPPPCTGPTPDPAPPEAAGIWPGGDPPTLRAAATAWNSLAAPLDSAAYRADTAFRTLLAHNHGAAFSTMGEYWSRRFSPDATDPLYNATPRTARILAQVTAALADLIERTRHEMGNAALDAAHDTEGAELLARLPPWGLPLTGAKLVGILAPVLVAGGYITMARDGYLQDLHDLTERLGPDLENRLRQAVATEVPRGSDPRQDDQVGVRAADVGEVLTTGLRGSAWDAMDGPHPEPDQIHVEHDDLIHILDGDARGGGHGPNAGRPNKTEFPSWWSENQVVDAVLDVARDPASRTRGEETLGPNIAVEGTRNGVLIRVYIAPDGSIATPHPLEGVGVITNPP